MWLKAQTGRRGKYDINLKGDERLNIQWESHSSLSSLLRTERDEFRAGAIIANPGVITLFPG
jgi:hypothetical protein